MKRSLITACLYTVVTAVLLGIGYPLLMLGIGQVFFRDKANGQLIIANNKVIGSRLIGQPFTGAGYFHSRVSAAGTGYDAQASSGSNLGPTNKALVDRIDASVARERNATGPAPIDLVTASASGLDPDITPEAAFYQAARVAEARRIAQPVIARLVEQHIIARQFGLLGEARVNVVALNLALDQISQTPTH